MSNSVDEPGRDWRGGLKCDVSGCRKVIHAMTGLQEIQKLQAHMHRAHQNPMGMNEALERRVEIETGGSPEKKLNRAIEAHDAREGRRRKA